MFYLDFLNFENSLKIYSNKFFATLLCHPVLSFLHPKKDIHIFLRATTINPSTTYHHFHPKNGHNCIFKGTFGQI